MAQEVALSLSNLKLLDMGKAHSAFDAELAYVVRDCIDRPHDDKPRKITMTFLIAPVKDSQSANADQVDVGVEIASSVPKRRTRVYTMNTRTNGQLAFHPDSPADPNDNRLFDQLDRETGEVREN